MKVSVSLSPEDLEFVDQYARDENVGSRSAVVQRAIRLLRQSELEQEYAEAMTEWLDSEDSTLWETTTADGL